jgi:hypothetical protein
MTHKTLNDIPDILNSISWQLKRIADHLDKQNLKDDEPDFQIESLSKSSQRSVKDILGSFKISSKDQKAAK